MSDKVTGNGTPKISVDSDFKAQLSRSPLLIISQASDDASSLNDDLSIMSRSRDHIRDSFSLRRSSFESALNPLSPPMHTVKHGLDYSPLVDNSIYEIVMNTRFKRWLKHPTTEDIPPVILCKNDIKNDWEKEIEGYKHEIGDEYKVYLRTNNISSLNMMEQIRSIDNSKTSGNHEGTFAAENSRAKAFEEIPSFYFDKDFKLDHPNFFRMLLQDFEFDTSQLLHNDDKTRNESYEELQGRLNFYLDTVESLLVSDISKSIQNFFAALEDVDQIKDNATKTIDQLDTVSQNLEVVCKEKVLKRIETIKDLIRRKNVEKLQQGILQVKLANDKTMECKKIYDEGDLQRCLKLIKSVERLLYGDNNDTFVNDWTSKWPYKLSNIYALPAVNSLIDLLSNLKVDIGGSYSLNLVNELLNDLRVYATSSCTNDILLKLQSHKDNDKPHLIVNEEFREQIKNNLIQLIECDQLVPAVKLYEEKFIAELKSVIKVNLPHEKVASDNPDGKPTAANGSRLSKLIQEQSVYEFQAMLVNVFTTEIEILKRLTRHQKLLLDISLGELPTTAEHSDRMVIDLDIRKNINEGIRIVQLRIGKIISVRREITNTLRFDHFLQFYHICILFMKECESISGEFLTKYLSDVLNVQIDTYMKSLQNLNVRVLKQKIEQEHWVPFKVEQELQKDVNDIVSCIDIDPASWARFTELDKPSPLDVVKEEDESSANTGHKKSVVLGDKTFVASDTLVVAIKMIKTLLILASNFPTQYARQCERQLKDLFKYFNTKTMESVSMKTDKNLNIMAESLDCLAEITLLVQGYFQRTLGSNPEKYEVIWKQFQQSSEKLFQANNIPPPV